MVDMTIGSNDAGRVVFEIWLCFFKIRFAPSQLSTQSLPFSYYIQRTDCNNKQYNEQNK